MTPFKIEPSGDYVQLIYVDAVSESVQQELKSDTDAFECSYDSDGKLFMQFGAMRFENPEPTDFEIDGSGVTDAADFITKLNALFTGGGGGGTTIYTGDGSIQGGDRTVDLNGNSLIVSGSGNPYLTINPTEGSVRIIGFDGLGAVCALGLLSDELGNDLEFTLVAAPAVGSGVSIIGDGVGQQINIGAPIIRFNGVLNLPTQAAPASPNDGDVWREDNTNTGLKIRINGVTKTIVVA